MTQYVYHSQTNVDPQGFVTRLARTSHDTQSEQALIFGSAADRQGLAVTVRFAFATGRRLPVERVCETNEACGRLAMRLRLVSPIDPIDTH